MKPKRSGKTRARFLILDFDLDTNLDEEKYEKDDYETNYYSTSIGELWFM